MVIDTAANTTRCTRTRRRTELPSCLGGVSTSSRTLAIWSAATREVYRAARLLNRHRKYRRHLAKSPYPTTTSPPRPGARQDSAVLVTDRQPGPSPPSLLAGTLLCPCEVKIIKGRLLLILAVNLLLLGSPTLAPPGGTHGYSFGANGGTGSGPKTATTTNTIPSDPVVSDAPTPTPEPPTPEPPTPEPPTPEPPTPRAAHARAAHSRADAKANTETDATFCRNAGSPAHGFANGGRITDDLAARRIAGSDRLSGCLAERVANPEPSIASTSPGTTNGRGGGASILGPNGKLAGPLGTWLATTAGGLALFILLLPRRREKPQAVLAEGGSLGSALPMPQTEDKRVARWLRRSLQSARAHGSVSAASSAIARRSRGRPRTPRNL